MAYKTVLVYVDDAKRCVPLLKAACQIAVAEGAHLIGLHVIPDIQVYAAAEAQLPPEVFETQRQYNLEMAAKAEALFVEMISPTVKSFEWRAIEEDGSSIGDRVLEQALVADLVITGQIDPEIASRRRVGTPERVLLSGRRPILLVPYVGFASFGHRVAVAWNGSAEASRAVYDSMPLLKSAESVSLISVDVNENASHPASPEALAICLARHGIEAQIHHVASAGVDIGNVLLSRLADEGDDLLVMGGYGHSRLREFVFGGATRAILQQMTVPVLMSH